MLGEILEKYLDVFPEDKAQFDALREQIKAREKLSSRKNFTGHVTGSAIVLTSDLKKMLLIYHPTHKAWQQPGGHWEEGETGPWLTAERELIEETGIKPLRQINISGDQRIPLQIDSHLVPAAPQKNEPEHYHHDFRYLFIADEATPRPIKHDAIKDVKWLEVEGLEDPRLVKAVKRANELHRSKRLKA